MPNCKVGDIAQVIRGENLGALVEVLAPTHLEYWQCKALSRIHATTFLGSSIVETLPPGVKVYVPDKILRPLRDGPESPHDQIPLPADAPHELPGYLHEPAHPEVLPR